jgi:membrane protein
MNRGQWVRGRMGNLWTLGGLSLWELIRRTARESWEDSVFGQGGRMAFYHFLAIFPSLIISAGLPYFRDALLDLSRRIMPEQVSNLFEQSQPPLSELQLITVCAGALWAALNATWAMTYGLNRAYEVKEHRSFGGLAITIAGLTFTLALIGFAAAFFAYRHSGARWLILIASFYLSLVILYRFAPDVRDHELRWSTPGALCALLLCIGSTCAARVYFDRIDSYVHSYGRLNGVAILLLWLYFTNGAVLIGGEMNSEIQKAAK